MADGGPPPDIRVLAEERVDIAKELVSHRLRQEGQDRALGRQRKRVEAFLSVAVIAMALPYLGYVALYGSQNHQVWATHLIAVIVGGAVGAMWRGSI